MNNAIEKDILQYGLIIGIVYEFYQTTISLIPVLYLENALINILLTLLLVFLLVMAQRRKHVQLTAFVLHVVALGGFTYFWSTNGGLAGTVPSFLCAYVAFIVVTSHGVYRWVGLSLFTMLVLTFISFPQWLGMKGFHEPEKIGAMQTAIDYLVIATIIVIIVLYIKKKFIFYREQVAKRNKQLKHVAHTLHQQNLELATREEETRAINDNLEAIVHERTQEMENKNQALAEFAFINAHMLRGPVCRIIGLLQLMEREPERYDPAQLQHWKKTMEEIDAQIQNINKVLS